jgi:hypothetical protein
MKAKANQKPSEQYHPQIMQLLLNPMVKGIEGAGYAPYMNFSIFDLSEHNIEVLINHGKKSFIANQIKAEPIEFLKAPSYIKNNPEYQQVAIKSLPELRYIIGKENNLAAWENAINEEESLIIYAPNTLKDFTKLVTLHLRYSPSDILKSPKNISTDFNILKSVLDLRGLSIQYIIPSTPKYNELCKIAVLQNGDAFSYIPEEYRTFELCKIAVSYDGDSISYVPEKFRTFELCKIAVEQSGYSLRFIMASPTTLTYDEQLKLCKIAVSNDIKWIRLVPDHIKDKVKQELNIQESLDFKYFQNL